MNEQMGIDGEGALPKQVDALCRTCFGSAWQPSPAVQPEHVAVGVAIDSGSSVPTPTVAAPPAAAPWQQRKLIGAARGGGAGYAAVTCVVGSNVM